MNERPSVKLFRQEGKEKYLLREKCVEVFETFLSQD